MCMPCLLGYLEVGGGTIARIRKKMKADQHTDPVWSDYLR